VPDVPVQDADRAAEADWVHAVPVNTSAHAARTGKCSLRLLGQWARLSCELPSPAFTSWEKFEGFGGKDVDHFVTVLGNAKTFQLDFRMRPGGRAEGLLALDQGMKGRVAVVFAWPKDAARPTVLSVEES
jgi:hypothetical protein